MLPLGVGWAAFGIVVLIVLGFCYAIVKYYTDVHESEVLPSIVTTVSLSITLLALFLIPIDILSVSSTGDISTETSAIKALYYLFYACILAFTFVIIPFAYFYFEEFDEDVTIPQRIVAGLKYTSFLIVIVVILLVVGLFVKPGTAPVDNSVRGWADQLIATSNKGQGALEFAIACLTFIGCSVWMSYTAYGMAAYPLSLLKGKRHIAEESSDLQSAMDNAREQKRTISSRYLTGKKMSEKDARQYEILDRQERVLAKRNQRLGSMKTGWSQVKNACKPFTFVYGILLFLVSLLIIVSVILTLADKISNSCGAKCGWFADYPKIPNPIDLLLWHLAPYFPMDYIILGSVIVYIFFCTLSGIIRIGIRFIWVHLFAVRPKQTPPQGLLLASIYLMLALLVLNMEILTLAPRYATYGTQTYLSGNSTEPIPCSTAGPVDQCQMTQIAQFIARIQLGTAFFGNVFFFVMWAFVGVFFIGAIYTCVRRKSSNVDEEANDSDEDEI